MGIQRSMKIASSTSPSVGHFSIISMPAQPAAQPLHLFQKPFHHVTSMANVAMQPQSAQGTPGMKQAALGVHREGPTQLTHRIFV